MFSTCLFCHASLGVNQSIEHFPLAKRLAFDLERGRLWAVCPTCTRWNLTPIEERWEALEECERAYRDTRTRVSTDNIALARLKDGTDLVRIGRPLLPELAAWRYGEQLGQRRRKSIFGRKIPKAIWLTTALAYPAISATGIGYAAAGTLLPLAVQLTGLAIGQLSRRPVAHVTVPNIGRLPMRADEVFETSASYTNDGALTLRVVLRSPRRWLKFSTKATRHALTGDNAQRALSDVIVGVNHEGAKATAVADATRLIEDGATASSLLFSMTLPRVRSGREEDSELLYLPHAQRLALEISLHQDDERRAMAGELGALYTRWEEAERAAKIADGELTALVRSGVHQEHTTGPIHPHKHGE